MLTSSTTSFDPLLEDFFGFPEAAAGAAPAPAGAEEVDAAPTSCVTGEEEEETRDPQPLASGNKKVGGVLIRHTTLIFFLIRNGSRWC